VTDHDRFEQNLAAYALDALEHDDRVALEAHLPQCEHCRNTLTWLRPAGDALATSVPNKVPPRRLRRRTLAAARSDGHERRAAKPFLGRRGLAPIAAGLALAAVAFAIGTSIGGDSGVPSRTVAVQPATDKAPAADGVLIERDGTATLELEAMPKLAADEVYQAWLQRDGEIQPSTTFIVDRNGSGATTIAGVGNAEKIMVTREPRGGSITPSTAPLVAVSL
jgi:hypothetical protein